MLFRRSLQRYGNTPEPVTPYQKAEQLWDERIGSARVQAKTKVGYRLWQNGQRRSIARRGWIRARFRQLQLRISPALHRAGQLRRCRGVL